MSKQVLDVQQTQHLKELGVDTSQTYLCQRRMIRDCSGNTKIGKWSFEVRYPFIEFDLERYQDVPFFTLQDILDLLPGKHEGAYLTITKTDKSYIMGYEDEDGGASPVFMNEQAIDSAYEMLCWCAENGIIETKKDK